MKMVAVFKMIIVLVVVDVTIEGGSRVRYVVAVFNLGQLVVSLDNVVVVRAIT